MRKCTKCLNDLNISEFNERAPGYLYRQCKKCRAEIQRKRFENHPKSKLRAQERSKQWYLNNRERALARSKENHKKNAEKAKWHRLWYSHRISKDTYLSILNDQNGLCKICNKSKRLYVDHDHSCCNGDLTCGQCIRGLICQKCNILMHYVDEYSDFIDIAKSYSKTRIKNPDKR